MTTSLQQFKIYINDDEYFIKFKNRMIANAVKFIKNSYKDGKGEAFINYQKDNLRKVINCNSLNELLVVERNLLNNEITTNLSYSSKNKIKQSTKTNNIRSRLRVKLLKQTYGK